MTNVLELFDWIDEGRTCWPITDEDRRLFIGYSATPLWGGGVGFFATRDRIRFWQDYSAPTPVELIARLDALVAHGIERRHWVFIGETETHGLSAALRVDAGIMLAKAHEEPSPLPSAPRTDEP